ncbi:MAG: acetate/propionate family kinase [Gammaproteobacteria bacterium]|nr:acetate/propionate family kinase [Gammaproteobacteria bacterium]MBU1416534.1 acetate/propionate family kinase [Gammaproteobacteria bacterium]
MSDAILTINAGSSSIKFALFADGHAIPAEPEVVGQIDGIGLGGDIHPHLKAKNAAGDVLDNCDLPLTGKGQHRAALAFLVDWLRGHDGGREVVGVGHRVVHGAEMYSRPLLLDAATLDALRGFIPLAPLHQPHNIAGIEAMTAALPGVPQVACFDTAFHRSQPEIAQRFALPRAITEKGVRRYGFHGLSYEYIADVLPQHLGDKANGRVIVAHLGNGASMCAMKERRSVATTMGFTAVEGLMMGTRSGSLDPGVLLYLMDYQGMDAKALERLLYKESGLLGVSGISQDMRELLASDRPEAREAVDLFCYRIVREVGSLAAALGGLDALVFTGGIGEHAAPVRAQVCGALGWLGVRIDEAANARHDRRIAMADFSVDVLVLPTNEEWMIARHTAALID